MSEQTPLADGPFPQDTLPDGRTCPFVMFFGMRGDGDAPSNDSFTNPRYPMGGVGIGADVQSFDGEIKKWLGQLGRSKFLDRGAGRPL